MLPPIQTLAQASRGDLVLVTQVGGEGLMRRRLMDLGLVPGTQVKNLRPSPLGDPVAYVVRGAVIALRQEESSKIMVTPYPG